MYCYTQPDVSTQSARPADEPASCAREIREATNALEDIFHTILDPLTEEPEPGEDEV